MKRIPLKTKEREKLRYIQINYTPENYQIYLIKTNSGYQTGVIVDKDTKRVVKTSPTVFFLLEKTVKEVKRYCKEKGWRIKKQ